MAIFYCQKYLQEFHFKVEMKSWRWTCACLLDLREKKNHLNRWKLKWRWFRVWMYWQGGSHKILYCCGNKAVENTWPNKIMAWKERTACPRRYFVNMMVLIKFTLNYHTIQRLVPKAEWKTKRCVTHWRKAGQERLVEWYWHQGVYVIADLYLRIDWTDRRGDPGDRRLWFLLEVKLLDVHLKVKSILTGKIPLIS